MVVSACGRRFKGDTKVTDLLYLVNAHVKYHVSCEELLEDIGQRYFDIADELELTYPSVRSRGLCRARPLGRLLHRGAREPR